MVLDNFTAKIFGSGTTTPDSKTAGSSVPAHGLRRSDSQETITSNMTTIPENSETQSVVSIDSREMPGPPRNTPLVPRSTCGPSEAGDDHNEVDPDSLKEMLKRMPNSVQTNTPPASVRSKVKGKVQFSPDTEVTEFEQWHDPPKPQSRYGKNTPDVRLGNHSQLKSSPFMGTRGTNTPPAIVEFPEHSTWAGVAEEDVTSGLKRLTMLAKDEHKLNPSKSVSEYFSERLAKLIKDAEPEFNPKALE